MVEVGLVLRIVYLVAKLDVKVAWLVVLGRDDTSSTIDSVELVVTEISV